MVFEIGSLAKYLVQLYKSYIISITDIIIFPQKNQYEVMTCLSAYQIDRRYHLKLQHKCPMWRRLLEFGLCCITKTKVTTVTTKLTNECSRSWLLQPRSVKLQQKDFTLQDATDGTPQALLQPPKNSNKPSTLFNNLSTTRKHRSPNG